MYFFLFFFIFLSSSWELPTAAGYFLRSPGCFSHASHVDKMTAQRCHNGSRANSAFATFTSDSQPCKQQPLCLHKKARHNRDTAYCVRRTATAKLRSASSIQGVTVYCFLFFIPLLSCRHCPGKFLRNHEFSYAGHYVSLQILYNWLLKQMWHCI